MAYGKLSPKEWISQFYGEMPMNQIIKGQIDPKNPEYTAADWISGKEIRIFALPGINKKAVETVKKSIEDLVDELHLDIDVKTYNPDDSIKNPVEKCTSSNGLDYNNLSKMLALEPYRKPEMGGKQHADVVLVDDYFDDDKMSWGDSRFSRGTTIFALGANRKNDHAFLKNVAKHEAVHLLGYNLHCDDIAVPELESDDCVMSYETTPNGNKYSSTKVCDKCFNALNYFWLGLENITGKNFIKNTSPYK